MDSPYALKGKIINWINSQYKIVKDMYRTINFESYMGLIPMHIKRGQFVGNSTYPLKTKNTSKKSKTTHFKVKI